MIQQQGTGASRLIRSVVLLRTSHPGNVSPRIELLQISIAQFAGSRDVSRIVLHLRPGLAGRFGLRPLRRLNLTRCASRSSRWSSSLPPQPGPSAPRPGSAACFLRRRGGQNHRLGITPMRPRRNRQHRSDPRGSIPRSSATETNTASSYPLRESAAARRYAPAPSSRYPLRNASGMNPDRLPELIRLDVLRTPAAKEFAPIRRSIEHRFDQRRPDKLPPLPAARRSSDR